MVASLQSVAAAGSTIDRTKSALTTIASAALTDSTRTATALRCCWRGRRPPPPSAACATRTALAPAASAAETPSEACAAIATSATEESAADATSVADTLYVDARWQPSGL